MFRICVATAAHKKAKSVLGKGIAAAASLALVLLLLIDVIFFTTPVYASSSEIKPAASASETEEVKEAETGWLRKKLNNLNIEFAHFLIKYFQPTDSNKMPLLEKPAYMAPKFEVFETSKEEYPKVHTL
jgi:hypothetical protein